MKKKVDNLGRVILPAEVRRELGIQLGEELNLLVSDGKIILSKQSFNCAICGSNRVLIQLHHKGICEECYNKIKRIEIIKQEC